MSLSPQDYPSTGIDPGGSDHLHYIDLDKEPEMSAMVVRVSESYHTAKSAYTLSWCDCELC